MSPAKIKNLSPQKQPHNKTKKFKKLYQIQFKTIKTKYYNEITDTNIIIIEISHIIFFFFQKKGRKKKTEKTIKKNTFFLFFLVYSFYNIILF